MVAGQSVAVEWFKADKYGRKVSKVMLADMDCNLVQVKPGLAWHYKAYEREKSVIDRLAYADADIEAKAARRGLWADAEPVLPWVFRHK